MQGTERASPGRRTRVETSTETGPEGFSHRGIDAQSSTSCFRFPSTSKKSHSEPLVIITVALVLRNCSLSGLSAGFAYVRTHAHTHTYATFLT